jgi:hypothetical protein
MSEDNTATNDIDITIYDCIYYHHKQLYTVDKEYNVKLMKFNTHIDQIEFHKLVLEFTIELCEKFNLTLFKQVQLSHSSYYNYLAKAMQIMRYIIENPNYNITAMISELKLSGVASTSYYPALNKLSETCYIYEKYVKHDFNLYITQKILEFCINNKNKFDNDPDTAYIFSKETVTYTHMNYW